MKTLIFKSISMRNFQSYGNTLTTINLDTGGSTFICGENRDNTINGPTSNGTGKTTIITALTFAWYDNTIDDINKDDLINNINKKNMEVISECVAPSGKTYKVRRTRKMTGDGNSVFLYEDGKDITPDSIDATNRKIVEILGVPYDLFTRIVIFSASHRPFLSLPVRSTTQTNQSDMIEELFGLTSLSTKADILKAKIKSTDQLIKIEQTKLEALEDEIKRNAQQIKTVEARIQSWEDTRTDSIAKIDRQLAMVEGINIAQEKKLHDTLAEVNEELRTLRQEAKELIKAEDTLVSKISKAEKELAALNDSTCPYCKQHFVESEGKKKELAETIESSKQKLAEVEEANKIVTKDIAELDELRDSIKSRISVDNIDRLVEIQQQSATLLARRKDLEESTNPHIETLEDLKSISVKEFDYTAINELTKLKDHQNFLLKLLTKKDSFVRKSLLNKNLPYLNSRVKHYLSILGLPYSVEFTEEMTASIAQFGRKISYGNLSAGQKARVNLALSYSFSDVMQRMHCHINIQLLDEVLDTALDTVGVQSAAKMIKERTREEKLSSFVISHKNEAADMFNKKLKVLYENGFSSVEQ